MSQNLKFIHLGSNVAATNNTANAGAIIFEPMSGRIAVQGKTNLEYYGGNIKNATFVDKVLTLSFNKGEDIKLDFNDVASAEGMTTLLSGLRDKIDALRTDVTALQGTSHTHGNKRVLDDITDDKVSSWDAVAGAKSTYDTHIGNTDIHVTTEDKAKWNAAEKNAKDYADGKVGEINTKANALGVRVTNLEGTVGKAAEGDSPATGLVKKVADNEAAIDLINHETNGILAQAKSYTDTTVNALGGRVSTLETSVGKSTDAANADGSVYARIKQNAADIATLISGDTGKSVRVISAEEVAKVVAGAPASYDTLKEIADWIANDTTDAAKMANDISALKTSVGAAGDTANETGTVYARIAKNKADIATNTTNIEANTNAIDALEALHEPGKKVADEVADGIKGLGTVTKTNNEGDPKTADVVVTVTTTEGKVSAVGVDASVLKKAVTDETTRATDVEQKLRADLGKKADNEGDAFTRIKALEEKQSSGSLTWFDWQN